MGTSGAFDATKGETFGLANRFGCNRRNNIGFFGLSLKRALIAG
jgi:hypothetical protein